MSDFLPDSWTPRTTCRVRSIVGPGRIFPDKIYFQITVKDKKNKGHLLKKCKLWMFTCTLFTKNVRPVRDTFSEPDRLPTLLLSWCLMVAWFIWWTISPHPITITLLASHLIGIYLKKGYRMRIVSTDKENNISDDETGR